MGCVGVGAAVGAESPVSPDSSDCRSLRRASAPPGEIASARRHSSAPNRIWSGEEDALRRLRAVPLFWPGVRRGLERHSPPPLGGPVHVARGAPCSPAAVTLSRLAEAHQHRRARGGDTSNISMDVAESFGQRVDLTARLREILAAYPEGTTFLRELLQNAVRRFWRTRAPPPALTAACIAGRRGRQSRAALPGRACARHGDAGFCGGGTLPGRCAARVQRRNFQRRRFRLD